MKNIKGWLENRARSGRNKSEGKSSHDKFKFACNGVKGHCQAKMDVKYNDSLHGTEQEAKACIESSANYNEENIAN